MKDYETRSGEKVNPLKSAFAVLCWFAAFGFCVLQLLMGNPSSISPIGLFFATLASGGAVIAILRWKRKPK